MAYPPRAPSRGVYPQPDPDAVAAINDKLTEIVSLLHSGRLSDAQRRELAQAIALQTANATKLHQFPLSNADEPAFVASLTSGD